MLFYVEDKEIQTVGTK